MGNAGTAAGVDRRLTTGTPGETGISRNQARSTNVTSPQTSEATQTGVVLTDAAATKAKALLEQEGRDDLRLRVAVQPGGCSGLRYQLFFDERDLEGDNIADFGGVEVVVDRMSAPYLMGATIDFVDRIDAQGFTIDNPNAQGSCACGDSFH
jgi:iron-sulfur cluster assembly accessory protein